MNKTFHANNIHYNACVGLNGDFDIDTYALGYFENVKVLIDSTIAMKTTLDAIVYPIVYSARHYIELTLKHQIEILIQINKIVDSKFNSRIRAIHEISILWDEFRKLSLVDNRYLNLTYKAEEYITDYSEIDDNGETFRYPYSNENKKYLTQLYCIDIKDFGIRFYELHEILDEIVLLTGQLVEEYNQRSFVGGKSRAEIEEIAQKLPHIDLWTQDSFRDIKDKIKYEYSISSNQLSKIITFIKSHREFSAIIDNEIKIKEISNNDLEFFLEVYNEYLSNKNRKDFFTYLHETSNKMCQKLTKKKLASIAQLYNMGYFRLYSEEYDRGLSQKMNESKSELVRIYLLGNGIVKENIFRGLHILGQKSLMKVFDKK